MLLPQKTFEEKTAIVAAGRPKFVERLFSSLKRIKSISRNKMGQDRLSDLRLISIESQLLTEVIETKFFKDSVITKISSAKSEWNLLLNDFLASTVILKLCRCQRSALCSKQFCLNCYSNGQNCFSVHYFFAFYRQLIRLNGCGESASKVLINCLNLSVAL